MRKKFLFSKLLPFILPFYIIRFSIFNIPTNLLEVFIILSFLFYLFVLFRNQQNKKNLWLQITNIKKQLERIPYKNLLFLIFLGFITSTLINKKYETGFGIIKSWLIIPFIAVLTLYLEIYLNKKPHKTIKNFLQYFVISSTLIVLISLFTGMLIKLSIIHCQLFTYDHRLKSFFDHPNMLAIFLSYAFLSCLYLISGQKKYQKINLACFFILLLGIILTQSSSTIISLLISLIAYLLIKKRKKLFSLQKPKLKSPRLKNYQMVVIPIIIIFLLFVFYLLLFIYSQHQYYTYFFGPQTPLTSRYAIWRTSLHLVKDNAIFGIGPGDFQTKYLEYQKFYPPYPEWAVPHPHNIFLMILLYGGIISFVTFIYLVYKYLYLLIWQIITPKGKQFYTFTFIIFLHILIQGCMENTLLKNDFSLLFLIILYLPLLNKKVRLTPHSACAPSHQ